MTCNAIRLWKAFPHYASVALLNDEAHVWCVQLNQTSLHTTILWKILATDEQCRAERFHISQHKEQFVVARAMLRTILSRYLHLQPERPRFHYNRSGKLYVVRKLDVDSLRFSVSRSGGIAIYGITRGREVGIDLEHIRPGFSSNSWRKHSYLGYVSPAVEYERLAKSA